MEVNGQIEAPATLPPEKNLRRPLNRRMGGTKSRYGRFGEENDLLPLLQIDTRIVQTIA